MDYVQLVVLSKGDDAAKNLWCSPSSSNCVINLAPDKRAVLREAYRVLKVGSQVGLGWLCCRCLFSLIICHPLLTAFQPGGEMYFSDVYANQHLSEAVRKHRVLWGV